MPNPSYRLLYVDDTPDHNLLTFAAQSGFSVTKCDNDGALRKAVERQELQFDLALVDYKLQLDHGVPKFRNPYEGGIQVTQVLRKRFPQLSIVGVSKHLHKTISQAISSQKQREWLQSGAVWSVNTDDIATDQGWNTVVPILQELAKRTSDINGRLKPVFLAVPKMPSDLLEKAALVGQRGATVLITGETGVGKEELAKLIHQHHCTQRATDDKPVGEFVAVNCAGIPDSLFESEMFGHEKGAFTGAQLLRKGYFEQAAGGGVLFLDEIGDLPLGQQAKLLRALECGRIQRVGGSDDIGIDALFIFATNRPLEEMVAKKEFREDLYHRLDIVRLHIPPLVNRLVGQRHFS